MILANLSRVPSVFAAIVTNAFTGTAAIGGFAGCAVSEMIRVGMARSVYSNEAGWGTSPMIHASAQNTVIPWQQGLWGSFEVFFDTFVVCSITAVSVLLSGRLQPTARTAAPWHLSLPSPSAFGSRIGSAAAGGDHGHFYGDHLRRLVYLLPGRSWSTLCKKEGPVKDPGDESCFTRVRALPGPSLDHLSGKDRQPGLYLDAWWTSPPPFPTFRQCGGDPAAVQSGLFAVC